MTLPVNGNFTGKNRFRLEFSLQIARPKKPVLSICLDGLDTYREIQKRHPGQRAIIASGFSETRRVRDAQKLGAEAYIKKPYALKSLAKAVRAELDDGVANPKFRK